MKALFTLRTKREEAIFPEHRDYVKFLQILVTAKKRYANAMYAFCLMPDYCQLIAQFSDRHKIREFLRLINKEYEDHLFISYAIRNPWIKNEVPMILHGSFELLDAIKNIECAPVCASIVRTAADYPYSSAYYRDYRVKSVVLEEVV
jgi:putative transposase